METDGKFYIGTSSEDQSPVLYDPDDLTTHAVVVGMTGSGKTGLCIDMLEEAALQNIPALMIDPKGDITNTLLHFPDLLPTDFEPWINPDEARKNKITLLEAAEKTAAKWKKGLKGSGIGKERIQKLKDSAQFTVYTPGSKAGKPVNILASLEAPKIDWDDNEELLREKISATVTALLGLIGFENIDPVQSREHILLANIFEASWIEGNDLTLSDLINFVQKPPFDKLGVFDLDTFFSEKDRFGLAMRLNNIMASPSFQSWVQGQPLDIQSLLYTEDGGIRHSVFYIAHLSDAERMFFVTLLYAAYESWMRAQKGTTSLRSILYFDEIFGYIPPTANPSSKPIMLRMLKQGRAFGVSQILVTQNPVDLDYKAMSNAGTWMIGKLQTENDKKRLLEGLEGVTSASINRKKYDKLITGLKKREFLLHNIHEKKPVTFSTRWAINYLAGPLTRTQIPALNHLAGVDDSAGEPSKRAVKKTPAKVKTAKKSIAYEKSSPLPAGATEFYLPNNLSLTEAYKSIGREIPAGAKQTGMVFKPSLISQAEVRFVNRTYHLDKLVEISCLVDDDDLGKNVAWDEYQITSIPSDQLSSNSNVDAEFSSTSKNLSNEKSLKTLSSDFINWIYTNYRLSLQFNKTLKLYSKPDQTEGQFRKTISEAAQKESEKEIKKLKDSYKKKISALKKKVTKEKRELDEDEKDHSQRKMMELATHFENNPLYGLATVRKAFDWRMMMDILKIVIGIGIAVGIAGFVYVLVILPWQLRRGASNAKIQRSLPGDDVVPSPKSGYTQAITIKAQKSEVWKWLVQIGYKRAGWYTYDFLHRLVGIAGCVDDERRSAKRIIPELQDLGVGDVIEIAPGMGYTVVGLEPEQTLILQSILDTGKWISVSSDDPLPEKYLRSSWVWFLEEIDENTTRLIVRVRSDHNPGLLSTLSTRIPNALGRLLMQPRTLRVLKQRAEMSVS